MTLFEQHMRKYHPDSTTARLSREVEELRLAIARKRADGVSTILSVTPYGFKFGYTEGKENKDE